MNYKPKVLVWDIEASPMITYTFQLYDQNIRLEQVKEDWSILAWGAKWLGDPPNKTIYKDNSKSKNIHDDKYLVKELIKLLNQADSVITHNGNKFDIKRVNARAIINGLPPIRPFVSTDTYKESKKVFSFTSHSLEYMSEKLNTEYKKLKHNKYPGLQLWKAVLANDKEAWKEMKKYCINDVLTTEELFNKIQGWVNTQNISVFYDDVSLRCKCGSVQLEKRGYAHTNSGKYQIYHCKVCGKWPRSSVNLLTKDKKKSLLKDWR